ncbi:MAG: hypothetical protein JO228_09775 [Xanthobacteraceae bacterium]|nr:hypothetical protein [Xanthobacteraceae bacterium]
MLFAVVLAPPPILALLVPVFAFELVAVFVFELVAVLVEEPIPVLVLLPALFATRGAALRPQLGNENSWLSEDEIQGFCSFEEARDTPIRVRLNTSSAETP